MNQMCRTRRLSNESLESALVFVLVVCSAAAIVLCTVLVRGLLIIRILRQLLFVAVDVYRDRVLLIQPDVGVRYQVQR